MKYAYAPGNKRIWRGTWNGSDQQTVDEITYYSVNGQKLATYGLATQVGCSFSCSPTPPLCTGLSAKFYATQSATFLYFGGKLVKNAAGNVHSDIRGSIGKYFPYGQERPSATADGKEKFATYFRDADTGLDYADQRYHNPGQGRFMSPDPYMASGGPSDPGSWNRYAYTRGDPVNRVDPRGLMDEYCNDYHYSWMIVCGGAGGGGDGFEDGGYRGTDGGGGGSCGFSFLGTAVCALWVDQLVAQVRAGPTVPEEPNCASEFVPILTNAPHYDVLYRVLNENSFLDGAPSLLLEDVYIVSVLWNRANDSTGHSNLSNGGNSKSIDDQARYAGSGSTTDYNYANLSNIIAKDFYLPLNSSDCQKFLSDIATAQAAIEQVLSMGPAAPVYYWYAAAAAPRNAGPLVTRINNTNCYGYK